MKSDNSKSSKRHILKLRLTSKLDLRLGKKMIPLSKLGIYYTWKNIKGSYSNNKFQISAPTWNEQFKIPDACYSVSDIQDYFEYILKKHGKVLIRRQYRYILIKLKIGLHLKLKTDIHSNF